MPLKWSILIPSVVTRGELLKRLIERLQPQVKNANGEVEVVIFWNNFERQIGEIRQMMLEEAKGDYVSFIDDDDLVPEYYVEKILPNLDGVDYIGFRIAFYQNGVKNQLPVIHSLACKGWYETDEGFFRRAVHINPIKKGFAFIGGYDQADYTKGIPEERIYHDTVSPLLKTEHFIDEELYIYLQTNDHMFKRFHGAEGSFKRPELPKYFRYHPESTHES